MQHQEISMLQELFRKTGELEKCRREITDTKSRESAGGFIYIPYVKQIRLQLFVFTRVSHLFERSRTIPRSMQRRAREYLWLTERSFRAKSSPIRGAFRHVWLIYDPCYSTRMILLSLLFVTSALMSYEKTELVEQAAELKDVLAGECTLTKALRDDLIQCRKEKAMLQKKLADLLRAQLSGTSEVMSTLWDHYRIFELVIHRVSLNFVCAENLAEHLCLCRVHIFGFNLILYSYVPRFFARINIIDDRSINRRQSKCIQIFPIRWASSSWPEWLRSVVLTDLRHRILNQGWSTSQQ